MATNHQSLEAWSKAVHKHNNAARWVGFVPYDPYEDHFAENRSRFAQMLFIGAVPMIAGLWLSNGLASSYSPQSRPTKALSLVGQTVLGFSNTMMFAWLSCIGVSAFSKGRVLALNTNSSRFYLISTWNREGNFAWSLYKSNTENTTDVDDH